MSDEKMNGATGEKEKTVVITPDDCNAASDFWKHFNVPMPDDLKAAFLEFSSNPTFENQDKVKLALCEAIHGSQHEAFKDEMFEKIVEECASVSYKMKFDREITEALTVPEDKENKE